MYVRYAVMLAVATILQAQKDADWPAFNRDLAGTRYSPLTQINTRNVATLTKAWTVPLNVPGTEVTPLVIGGVMYLPADKRVMALDAETGTDLALRSAPRHAFALRRCL